jgi:hypothetical protein
VTVGSRMPGFVTQWPSLIFSVAAATSGKVAYESCQRCASRTSTVFEAVLLRLLHQLDQPCVRRIGQDGDAEREGHCRRAYAEGLSLDVDCPARRSRLSPNGTVPQPRRPA